MASAQFVNPEAERAILGCLLMDERAWVEATDLTPSHFAVPAYQEAFATLLGVRASGRVIDPLIVNDELIRNGGNKLLALREETIADVANAAPIWASARHYADIVRRDAAMRRLMGLVAEVGQMAGRGDDVHALVAHAKRRLAELEGMGSAETEELAALIAERRAQTRGDDYSVATGIYSFDDTTGGLRAPQLTVVAARPGIGKTALAGTIAMRAAKDGIPVLMFSLEMGRFELVDRFVGMHTQTPVTGLSTWALDDARRIAVLDRAHRELRLAKLSVCDKVLTMPQISGSARRWMAKGEHRRALVVIDYLGLIRSTERSETRALEVGRMAWGAKVLAKDLNVPVILVAQLNRNSEKEQRLPTMADLRDSGEIEQHADLIVFPHREPPLHSSGPAKLIIAKNRGGKVGSCPCYWHAEYMTFTTDGLVDRQQMDME